MLQSKHCTFIGKYLKKAINLITQGHKHGINFLSILYLVYLMGKFFMLVKYEFSFVKIVKISVKEQ